MQIVVEVSILLNSDFLDPSNISIQVNNKTIEDQEVLHSVLLQLGYDERPILPVSFAAPAAVADKFSNASQDLREISDDHPPREELADPLHFKSKEPIKIQALTYVPFYLGKIKQRTRLDPLVKLQKLTVQGIPVYLMDGGFCVAVLGSEYRCKSISQARELPQLSGF